MLVNKKKKQVNNIRSSARVCTNRVRFELSLIYVFLFFFRSRLGYTTRGIRRVICCCSLGAKPLTFYNDTVTPNVQCSVLDRRKKKKKQKPLDSYFIPGVQTWFSWKKKHEPKDCSLHVLYVVQEMCAYPSRYKHHIALARIDGLIVPKQNDDALV